MIELSSLVVNNEIYISEKYWSDLNQQFSREEIAQAISDAIETYSIPLPTTRDVSEQECIGDFVKLKEMDCLAIFKKGETFTRYEYNLPLSDTYIDSSFIGNKSSDYFHQQNRFKADSVNSPSPYRSWTIEKFRLTLLKSLWSLKFKEINSAALKTAISLRKFVASQFRPSAAKAIYQRYNARNVLDFSAGWGDRLAGFCAAPKTESYLGIDPNSVLFDGYHSQQELYGTDKSIKMVCSPAEDAQIPEDAFDTVFTSPPYYNVERYSRESTQSWVRYKKFDLWLEGFLFPTLDKCWNSLQEGGHLIINVSDVYSGHRINPICNSMNGYISNLAGAQFEECIGLRMAKRPNSAAAKHGIFVEPVWVWGKGKV